MLKDDINKKCIMMILLGHIYEKTLLARTSEE
jgi:hypothetical protein